MFSENQTANDNSIGTTPIKNIRKQSLYELLSKVTL